MTGRRVILALALALAAAALPLAGLPRLAEWAIERRLEAAFGAPAEVTVTALGWTGLVLSPVSVGDDLRLARVELDWRPLAGRVDAARVRGAQVRVRVAGGVSVGGLERLAGEGGGVGSVSVSDSWLLFEGGRAVPVSASLGGGRLSAEADPAALLARTPLAGRTVRLTVAAHPTPDGTAGTARLEMGEERSEIRFAVAGGQATLTLPEPLRLSLPQGPAPWPLALTLGGIGERPGTVTLGGTEITVALAAEARTPDGRGAALEIEGAARLVHGRPQRLDLSRLRLDMSRMPFGGGEIDGMVQLSGVEAQPPGGAAAVRMHLLGRGLAGGEAALSLAGRMRFEGGQGALTLDQPGRLWLSGQRFGETVALAAPAELTVLPGAALDFAVGPPGWLVLRPGMAVRGDLRLTVAGLPMVAALPRIVLGGSLALPDGPWAPVAMIDAAALSAETLGVHASLAGRLELAERGPAASLSVHELRRNVAGRQGVALHGGGELRGDADRLRFALHLSDSAARASLRLEGEHDPASGAGRATLTVPAITFAPDGLQPRALFPILGDPISGASGSLGISGAFRWTTSDLQPDLKVVVKELSGTVAGVEVRRLNAAMHITGLSPMSTPPGQAVAVGLIDAGLPLTDNRMTFAVERGRLRIERGEGRLGGGSVELRDATYDPAARRQRLVLGVSGVALPEIVAMTGLEGLTATGTLDGAIPVVVAADHILIDDARLSANSPGILRYRPKQPPAAMAVGEQSMELVLKALDDFHYDKLTMTLNGRAGGELVATMHLTGANPALYGGYPIEFNLNVSGRLDSILDDALSGYQIPDRIRERMSEFGAQ